MEKMKVNRVYTLSLAIVVHPIDDNPDSQELKGTILDVIENVIVTGRINHQGKIYNGVEIVDFQIAPYIYRGIDRVAK